MAGKRRRRFGAMRKLPSGRYQVSYLGPDSKRRNAPETFPNKTAAEQYLARLETTMMAGEWADPAKAKIHVGDYADQWITQRPRLSPRTVDLYRWLLAKHIEPYVGRLPMGKLTPAAVRQWRVDLLAAGVSQTMAAKAYRLLRAVLNTAVDEDSILVKNPCRVRGADQETPSERPVLTVKQVFELADAMPVRRLRTLILVTAFCTLRWGEVVALRRGDVAPDGSRLHVRQAVTEVARRGVVVGPPKSRAGVRTLIVPAAVRAELVQHLEEWVDAGSEALLFPADNGKHMRRSNFSQRVKWTQLVTRLGMKGVHFHDLRHAGNIWVARVGVSTKDLMARMGHDDMRAALIYQRATQEADQAIADQLSKLADEHRSD
ncbi:tyrosine-type recombinase/integrase [Actinokineospora terrae]|uniref:Site-specific recombinase XerD n=1 Tax=Actinokineospora terrae TaxID=155974 RepID=A0A1H9W369_9PSEU|nr:site-specific integrase [Actinokineospora terrae]SES28308.1 Site-specific recombinase XerD [Actinokineospora terrae]